MLFKRPLFWLMAVVLIGYCASSVQAVVNTPIRSYAILVGSDAPSAGKDNAILGNSDVDRVASELSWMSQIITLKYNWLNSDTFASDLQAAASEIGGKIKPDDTFIFYYSGHGIGGPGDGVQDYLKPVQIGALQDDSLAGIFSGTAYENAKKTFILDCCHAEGIWLNDTASDKDLETLKNISFIGSATENGTAYSNPTTGASYFTNSILGSLNPTATFGELLMTASSGNGSTVTGYFKDDGYGTGVLNAVTYTSAGFDLNTQLNGKAVPEPAIFVMLIAAGSILLLKKGWKG